MRRRVLGLCRSKADAAAKWNDQASEVFEQGTRGRQNSDKYVRAPVTLATVLLLMTIGRLTNGRSSARCQSCLQCSFSNASVSKSNNFALSYIPDPQSPQGHNASHRFARE